MPEREPGTAVEREAMGDAMTGEAIDEAAGDQREGHGKDGEGSRSRRAFLAAGTAFSVGASALTLAAASPAAAQDTKGESLLDKWTRTKKAKLGVDLTSAPLRFRDASGKPTGMGIEFVELMMKDIGVEPEYVEMPFAQTFAALAAGQFDMIATFVTILPTRGLRGTFAGFPAHYQQNVAYLKEGSKVTKLSELNSPDVSIACMQGTSEEYTLKLVYTKAKIQAFPQLSDAINSVGTGRADALVTDALFWQSANKSFPNVRVLPETVNAIANTFFMPHNDFKLWSYVTNWLRYQACLRVIQGLEEKWFGTELRDKQRIPSITVGSGGEPLLIMPD
jgi:polar amino acid transport system substrate-binding protein